MKTAVDFIRRTVPRAGLLAFLVVPLFAASATVPDMKALWHNYPNGEASVVKKAIGGEVDKASITHTSVIRLSRAFNYSGAPIPEAPGLDTLRGADKLRYADKVSQFKTWLISKYGQPTLSLKAGPYGTAPAALRGKAGIIMFEDCGWTDVVGHFDLWDGQKVIHHGYFELAKRIYLWEPQSIKGKLTAATSVRAGPSASAQIVGNLPAGTVVNLVNGEPTSNFYNIGNGQYVNAQQVEVLK